MKAPAQAKADMGPRIEELYFQVERERGTRAANKISINWVLDMVRIWASDTPVSIPEATRQVQGVLKEMIGIWDRLCPLTLNTKRVRWPSRLGLSNTRLDQFSLAMAGVIILVALATGLMRVLMSQGPNEEFHQSASKKMVSGIVAAPQER